VTTQKPDNFEREEEGGQIKDGVTEVANLQEVFCVFVF
jgi:hypothetical protein